MRVVSQVSKQLKTQDLKKLENILKILMLGVVTASCSVSPQENNFWQQPSKITQKEIPKFSSLLHYCKFFLLFQIHFVKDCSLLQTIKQKFLCRLLFRIKPPLFFSHYVIKSMDFSHYVTKVGFSHHIIKRRYISETFVKLFTLQSFILNV